MLSWTPITIILFATLLSTAIANGSVDDCDAEVIPAKENGIEDQYIVVLKDNVSDQEAKKIQESVESNGAKVRYHWSKGSSSEGKFQGFSMSVEGNKRTATLRKAKKNCGVKYIEQDQMAKAQQLQCNTQQNAGWCLARIPDNRNNQFPNPSGGGAGAAIYVIDSGCNPNHPDLRGRVRETRNYVTSEGNQDNNGHGTACASMAAGTSCGAAKRADIYCLKVLGANGQGSYSGIIAAVNWAADRTDKGILSMSLGGGYSQAVNDAVTRAYNRGHLTVVAAGNDNRDASGVSPASTPTAITVGASDSNNNFAGYSNYGRLIDIVAPGSNCNGANVRSNGYSSWTGTSMSTPYVAGVCALIQVQNNWLQSSNAPSLITNKLLSLARNNVLRNMKSNTVNKLLYYNQCN